MTIAPDRSIYPNDLTATNEKSRPFAETAVKSYPDLSIKNRRHHRRRSPYRRAHRRI